MDRKAELLPELVLGKAEKGVDFLFLAVVNIVEMRSNLLMCDAPEVALAKLAFWGPVTSTGVMDLGSRVSRKKEFVPPLTGSMAAYVPPPAKTASSNDLEALTASAKNPSELVVDPNDPHGKVMRRPSGPAEEDAAPSF